MMPHDAFLILTALEQSGLAVAIRQSMWAYPAANVGHIVALTLFAGSVLFTAEASHVGTNRVFQVKAALIVLGLSNAVFSGRTVQPLLDSAPAFAPMPRRVRLSAYFSLGIWVCVAACGRLIAYF
jgi:hypothetical protein